MFRGLIIFPVGLAVALISCKKTELPKDETGDPEFFVSSRINGIPYMLEAGNDSYFMDATWMQDSAGYYIYSAELSKSPECSNGCGYSVQILIRDKKISSQGAPMWPDSALTSGEHFYQSKIIRASYYRARFMPLRNDIGSFTWNITDGQNVIGPLNSYNSDLTIEAGKTYSLSLYFDDGAGICSSSHMNVYQVGKNLQANIIGTRQEPKSEIKYSFTCESSIKNQDNKYFWDFGDGQTSTAWNPTHTFTAQSQPYKVMMRLINKKDTCVSYYQVPGHPESDCDANFTMSLTPIPDQEIFPTVKVIVTDPTGKVYSSDNLLQPETSTFKLLSVENYSRNNNVGEPTKKLRIKFNCLVSDGEESIIPISSGDAAVAVAYRK